MPLNFSLLFSLHSSQQYRVYVGKVKTVLPKVAHEEECLLYLHFFENAQFG
jgi:hypothetical protein